jgi:TolB-like protein/Tfp pilus assembly protein PilF
MQGASPKPASTPKGAVFLSYASQDAEVAARICNALRGAGIEVWFDQSELRGGDAWDQSIRRQIKTCALFVPLISKHTHDRAEGYFRLEWKLGVDRSHLIMANKAFLVPVVIDETGDDDENVPERFREVQWTRLPAGTTSAEFVTRIQQLLSSESRPSPIDGRRPAAALEPRSRSRLGLLAVGAMLAALVAYLLVERSWRTKPTPTARVVTNAQTPVAFAPPRHSIAVLPFVNMSGDKEQEYFSDGISEELLNDLSRINELQVAARTSAFAFKGKDADIGTIARKLNVGAVLEGSVRRSPRTVRVTAQLINAVTGFHMWSQTYDRNLGDVLNMQTEIATAVARALKVTLLNEETARIEIGGTRDPAAYDAYLRASKTFWTYSDEKDLQAAIALYSEAIRLDPAYALAYAARSMVVLKSVDFPSSMADARIRIGGAQADARKAIALAPDLSDGHLALASVYQNMLEFTRATEEYERARALGEGNAHVLRDFGLFAAAMGYGDSAVTALRRAVTLDPLNRPSYVHLGYGLRVLRHYAEAIAAFREAEALPPPSPGSLADAIGVAYYLQGDFENARSACEKFPDTYEGPVCLAMTYEKLGRHADAQAAFARARQGYGDQGSVGYAEIYAQWGDTARALDALETAVRLRDPWLSGLKTDALLDPLRKEPRFQALERELKFPQ